MNSIFNHLLDDIPISWVPLGELGTFTRGRPLNNRDYTEKGFPCIGIKDIGRYHDVYYDKTNRFVSEKFAQKALKAKTGDLIVSLKAVDPARGVAWMGPYDVVIGGSCCIYRHNLNPKYVAYFFSTDQFKQQKLTYFIGVFVSEINPKDLAKIVIPVPYPNDKDKSLQVQEQIVNMLDKMNEIIRSLNDEINLRKKQYDYHVNSLFISKK